MALPEQTMEFHFSVPINEGRAFKHGAALYGRSLTAQFQALIRLNKKNHMAVFTAEERRLFLKGKLRIEDTEYHRRRHPPPPDDFGDDDDDRGSPDADATSPERELEDTAA